MSLLANCPKCPKTFRVPHAQREWRCKVCDSVLELETENAGEDSGDQDDGDACAACGAMNFGEATFCEECGEPLVEGAPQPAGLTRREAVRDMSKAMGRIRRLKTLLGLNLVLTILGTMALMFTLGGPGATRGDIVLECVVYLTILGLSYAAYRYVDRRPFPIVLALAAFQTLSVIWSYLAGAPSIIQLVWAVVFWWLVTDAAYATKIAAEHPDLYAAKRMRGENLTHKKKGRRRGPRDRAASTEGTDSVRARAAGRGSAETNWWLIGGVAAGVLVIGIAGVRATKRTAAPGGGAGRSALPMPTESPRAATEAFRVAWNSRDLDALAGVTKESLKEKLVASIEKYGRRYEWGDQLPPLGPAIFDEPKTGDVRVLFPSETGAFPVRFIAEDGRWVVRSIKASPLKDWRP